LSSIYDRCMRRKAKNCICKCIVVTPLEQLHLRLPYNYTEK